MATSYPTSLDSYTNPTGSDELDDEVGTRTHSEFHADNNDAIEAIQAELGTDPSGASATVKARIEATETVANAALPTATAATTYQPLDSDLTAIAALTTTAYGRAVLALANQAALSALVDHGGLAGLSDDDHTQYVLASGVRDAQTILRAGNAAHTPLIVRGAVAQSEVLQQWQNSAGSALSYVDSSGTFIGSASYAGTVQNIAATGAYLTTNATGGLTAINRTDAAYIPFIVKGMAAQSGNLQEWQNSSGTVLASVASDGRSLWASGGSGAPGVSFASDTDTGLYSIGADVLGVAVGGGERIRVTTTAVGIGGLTPTAQLHVFGTGQETAAFTDAGATGATLYLQSVEGNFNSGGAVLFGAGVDKFAAIKSLYQDGTGNGLGNLAISTRAGTADTALTERLTVTWDGLVTIVGSTSRLKFGHADQAQTTVGAAGGASALPATPTKYFKVKDSGGTEYVIPAYAAA